jgi:hypothetical protein
MKADAVDMIMLVDERNVDLGTFMNHDAYIPMLEN